MTIRGNYLADAAALANVIDEDLVELDTAYPNSWLTNLLLELQGLRSGQATGQTKCSLCHSLIDKS